MLRPSGFIHAPTACVCGLRALQCLAPPSGVYTLTLHGKSSIKGVTAGPEAFNSTSYGRVDSSARVHASLGARRHGSNRVQALASSTSMRPTLPTPTPTQARVPTCRRHKSRGTWARGHGSCRGCALIAATHAVLFGWAPVLTCLAFGWNSARRQRRWMGVVHALTQHIIGIEYARQRAIHSRVTISHTQT